MSKRILIVEDEKNLARFVSLELQHEGYDVVTADNGREGLEMALEKDFDLILLDLMLPEMDGFEVTVVSNKKRYLYYDDDSSRFNHGHCCWFGPRC